MDIDNLLLLGAVFKDKISLLLSNLVCKVNRTQEGLEFRTVTVMELPKQAFDLYHLNAKGELILALVLQNMARLHFDTIQMKTMPAASLKSFIINELGFFLEEVSLMTSKFVTTRRAMEITNEFEFLAIELVMTTILDVNLDKAVKGVTSVTVVRNYFEKTTSKIHR